MPRESAQPSTPFHTIYDGEGKRVKKKVYDATGTLKEETVFVYSAGKLIAEYSTELPQNPTINYTATDQLGSPRVITDGFGQVKSRRDFQPFGEEAINNIGERPTSLKYGTADGIRQKFTGYQKDEETKLDFAEARMYENRHARFTAVDPLLASGKSANPQTFNRFVYCLNSPIIFIDPTGSQTAKNPRTKSSKGIIDVFMIRIPKEDQIVKIPREWRRLQRQAAGNGWTVNINFYGGQTGGLATSDLIKSLAKPNRFVLVLAHAYGRDANDSGIMTGNKAQSASQPEILQQLGKNGISTIDYTNSQLLTQESLPEIKAKTTFIFSCYPGSEFAQAINYSLSPESVVYFENPTGGVGENAGKVSTTTNFAAGFEIVRSLTLQNQNAASAVNDANKILAKDSHNSKAHLQDTRIVEMEPITVEVSAITDEIPIKTKP